VSSLIGRLGDILGEIEFGLKKNRRLGKSFLAGFLIKQQIIEYRVSPLDCARGAEN